MFTLLVTIYVVGWFGVAVAGTVHDSKQPATTEPRCHTEYMTSDRVQGITYNRAWDCRYYHASGCWRTDEQVPEDPEITIEGVFTNSFIALLWPIAVPFALVSGTASVIAKHPWRRPRLLTEAEVLALEKEVWPEDRGQP